MVEIERVARSVFSTRQWLDLIGGPYYGIRRLSTITGWCINKSLPAGWAAIRRGHRFYIYFVGLPSCLRELFADSTAPRLIALESLLVEKVFARLFTVKEWVSEVASEQYQINDLAYVYHLCVGIPKRPTDRPPKLPQGWHAVRAGDSWMIYHSSLALRASLLPSS